MNKRLINIAELSQMIGVSVNTLYSWVSQKKIPYVKMGRLTKFDLNDIDKWIEESKRHKKDDFLLDKVQKKW